MLFFLPKKPDTSSQLLMFQVFPTKTAPKRRVFSCHNSRFELSSSILFCFFLCLCDLSGFLVDFLVFCRFRWFSKKAKVHWFFNQLFQMFLEGFTGDFIVILQSCDFLQFERSVDHCDLLQAKSHLRFVGSFAVKKILFLCRSFVITKFVKNKSQKIQP